MDRRKITAEDKAGAHRNPKAVAGTIMAGKPERVRPARAGGAAFAIGEQRQGELVRYDPVRGWLLPFLGGISAEGASFSRDGNWVAYVGYPDGSLWRSRVDGSDRRQLTSPPFVAGVPAWSPDQRRIAFTGREDRDRHWQTYIVSVDGGSALPVTAEDRDQFGAWWSPEGEPWSSAGCPMMPRRRCACSILLPIR